MPATRHDTRSAKVTMGTKFAKEKQYLIAAIMFYTRIPVPSNSAHSVDILNRSRKYFPLIGLIIGALAVTSFYLNHLLFSHEISVALSMLTTILATGAFHEDGFADSCDGLGGGWSSEQVLTIMKDSRVGTYAVVGLIALLSIKFFVLLELSQLSILMFGSCYIAGHVISRQLSSSIIERYNYVQDIDLSKVKPITDRRLSSRDVIVSMATALFSLAVLALWDFTATVIASAVATLIAYLFARYCTKRIGGYTGDILGAVQQLSEVVFFLAFLACL